jgi:hypothetical protein
METLTISRPLRSSRISQKFGESKACVAPSGKVTSKVNQTCPTGTTSFYESMGMRGHNGHDVVAIKGEPVVHGATFDGWMHTEVDQSGGIGVDVVSNEPLFFKGNAPVGLEVVSTTPEGFTSYVKIRYWHLLQVVGHEGKQIRYGQMIGLADSTGASSGHHLHWAPKWCDKEGNGLFTWNGYTGCFDPSPYYTHEVFAGDALDAVGLPVDILTTPERRQLNTQLSLLTRFVLELREMYYQIKK